MPDYTKVAVVGLLLRVEELGSEDDGTWVFWVLQEEGVYIEEFSLWLKWIRFSYSSLPNVS